MQTAWVVAPYSVTTTSSLPPCLSSSSSSSIGTSYAIRSIDATSAERQSLYAIEPIRTPWICVFDEGKRWIQIYRGYVPSTKRSGGSSIPWICASDEGKRYSIYRGYVPPTKGSGTLYTVDMCLRRREAVLYIPWICAFDGGKRWIIRYEAPNSFNHC